MLRYARLPCHSKLSWLLIHWPWPRKRKSPTAIKWLISNRKERQKLYFRIWKWLTIWSKSQRKHWQRIMYLWTYLRKLEKRSQLFVQWTDRLSAIKLWLNPHLITVPLWCLEKTHLSIINFSPPHSLHDIPPSATILTFKFLATLLLSELGIAYFQFLCEILYTCLYC